MMRFPAAGRLIILLLTCCLFSLSSRAQWTSDPSVNKLITGSSKVSAGFPRRAISDGNGGMFVAWIDDDFYQGHVQRLDASGVVKWTSGGIRFGSGSSNNVLAASIVSDGSGGVVVAFTQPGRGVLVQRFNSEGAPQWTGDGTLISGNGSEGYVEIAGDGNGGAILSYEINSDIYAQRINAAGAVQWASGGVPVVTAAGSQFTPSMVADGSGGTIIAWSDNRDFATNATDIYAQRIDAAGNLVWTNNGVAIAVSAQNVADLKLATDGNGGMYIGWMQSAEIYIQHINATGNALWGANGKPVESTGSGKTAFNLVADGSGGMYATWTTSAYDIYAQRFNSAGAELWSANGAIVCNAPNTQNNADLVVDGSGALLLAWQDMRSGSSSEMYAQKFSPGGTAYWAANGVAVATSGDKQNAKLVLKSGSNNAIVSWLDYRNPDPSLYAQVLGASGGLAEIPVIAGFTPATGAAGTSVTISGTGFATTPADNIVYFGAVKAVVTQASYASLTVTVPAGATAEPISVQNTSNKLQATSQLIFRTQYSNAAELGSFDMRKRVVFTTTNQATTLLAYADIDGDGKTDLLGFSATKFIAFRNTATTGSITTSSLASMQVFTVTGLFIPQDIQTDDLDGDGKKDVVITDYGTNKIYILKNTSTPGTISFASPVAISVSGVFHVALSDIDGDGWVDIAFTNYMSDVSILRNLGTGAITGSSFSSEVAFSISGTWATWYVAAGDLDGDGKPDLVVTDGNASDKLFVLRNVSTPGTINTSSFATAVALTASSTPVSLSHPQIADIDGDGKPDITVDNYSASNVISIFRNISTPGSITTGSFGTRVDIPGLEYSSGLKVADVNGDGKPDIVGSNFSQSKIRLLQNIGTTGTISSGSFTSAVEFDTQHGISQVYSLAVIDMDGDGRQDLVGGMNAAMGILQNAALLVPTTQASNIVFTPISGNSINIGWTKGNGEERVVFMKSNNAGSLPAPVNRTDYFANGAFGFGNQIGTSGWYAVYSGTGNTVSVSNLSTGVTYSVMVLERNNNGYPTQSLYQTATAANNPANYTSPINVNSITTVSAALTNAATVDFDVQFGAPVTGLTTGHFALTTTGTISGASIASLTTTGTPAVYRVTVNTGSGDGTVALQLTSTAGLTPSILNSLPFTGDAYTIDRQAPVLTTTTIASDNVYSAVFAGTGNVITLQVAQPADAVSATALINGVAITPTLVGGVYRADLTVTSAMPDGIVAFSMTVRDAAGNTSTTTSVTSGLPVTIDQTRPVLNNVIIYSNNATTTVAKPGNRITVEFTSSEPLGAAVGNVLGMAATITQVSGTVWMASYTTTGTEPEGPVSFYMGFRDRAGNAGVSVLATTNSSSVVFDKTPPVIGNVSITSSNPLTGWAKPGDAITAAFTTNEAVETPTVFAAGQTATITNTGGNNWKASVTMSQANTNGIISFTINATDLAGNNAAAVTTTSDNSSVLYDKTAPAITGVTLSSGNSMANRAKVGDVITLQFATSEAGPVPIATIAAHPATVTNVSGNNWQATYTTTSADAEGLIAFNITAKDLAGNASVKSATDDASFVSFDKTIPVIGSLTLTSNHATTTKAKTGNAVTLRFTANEPLGTPTALIASHAVTASNTGGNNWEAVYVMTGTDAEGIIPVSLRITDLAGNQSITATATSNGRKVVFDRTAPVVDSIVRRLPTTAGVSSGPVTYRVFFSEPVTGVLKNKFSINKTGTANAVVDTVTVVNDSTYDVKLTGLAGNGNLRLDLAAFASVSDSTGNSMTAAFTTGALYTITTSVNAAPVFDAGADTRFSICRDAAPFDFSSLLKTKDTDNGQTLRFSINANPLHGTLGGFPASVASNGAIVMPANVMYTPNAGYTGADQFTINVSDGVATASINVYVTVNALPSATVMASQGTTLCGTNATLALSAAGGVTYAWTRDGAATGANSSQLAVNAPGSYTVTVTDANGCVAAASNSVVITAVQPPKAAFSFAGYCVNAPVVITNASTATGTVSYQWSDGAGNVSALATPSFTYTQTGSYSIKLKVSSSDCPLQQDSVVQTINIEKPAAAIRMPALSVQSMQLKVLQARTFGVGYQWTPAVDLSNATIANPVLRTGIERQYTVSIRSAAGCITVDTLLVKVFANNVYVPKVFTPNGDGQNDILYFNFINISKLEYVRVFNRQGKRVFETTNMNEGWDGKMNGALQPLESYVWVVKAVDTNGNPVIQQGTVTLLR